MHQSAAFFVCGQCDAAYESDSLLTAHKSRSHRGSCSDQRLHPQNGVSGQIPKSQSRQRTSPNDEDNLKPRNEKTGRYVRLVVEGTRGTLGDAVAEHEHVEYLFQPDGRFQSLGAARDFYVAENEVVLCDRPTDEEVAKINALFEAGAG
jgi:hypothetical protein